MKLSRLPTLCVAVAVVAGLTLPITTQTQNNIGVIDGRMLDENHAAVPNATVTAKNLATGLARSAAVSPIGTYRITVFFAGVYEVSVLLAGFSTQVTKDVEVRVGDTVTVDFAMKWGRSRDPRGGGRVPLVRPRPRTWAR
jgi:hypothetical protein